MKKLLFILIIVGLLAACSHTHNSDIEKPQTPVVDETTITLTPTLHSLAEDNMIQIEQDRDSEQNLVDYELVSDDLSVKTSIEQVVKKNKLPEGFVYLDEVVPYASYDIRYYSSNNFVGEKIEGYEAPLAIASKEMADALIKVSEDLYQEGYTLLIYDTYRPAKAVAFFKDWSANSDESMKSQYYPNEQKSQLFKRGYLSTKSGHSRGSTVDLTLVNKETNELVDMGSDYDLLDEISSFNTKKITKEQANNRKILRNAMVKHGFKEYSKEWWHYVLKREPFPNTYFDFDVE